MASCIVSSQQNGNPRSENSSVYKHKNRAHYTSRENQSNRTRTMHVIEFHLNSISPVCYLSYLLWRLEADSSLQKTLLCTFSCWYGKVGLWKEELVTRASRFCSVHEHYNVSTVSNHEILDSLVSNYLSLSPLCALSHVRQSLSAETLQMWVGRLFLESVTWSRMICCT